MNEAAAGLTEIMATIIAERDEARRQADALAEALREEWEMGHSEKCTNMEHTEGEPCHHPIPTALTIYDKERSTR